MAIKDLESREGVTDVNRNQILNKILLELKKANTLNQIMKQEVNTLSKKY